MFSMGRTHWINDMFSFAIYPCPTCFRCVWYLRFRNIFVHNSSTMNVSENIIIIFIEIFHRGKSYCDTRTRIWMIKFSCWMLGIDRQNANAVAGRKFPQMAKCVCVFFELAIVQHKASCQHIVQRKQVITSLLNLWRRNFDDKNVFSTYGTDAEGTLKEHWRNNNWKCTEIAHFTRNENTQMQQINKMRAISIKCTLKNNNKMPLLFRFQKKRKKNWNNES